MQTSDSFNLGSSTNGAESLAEAVVDWIGVGVMVLLRLAQFVMAGFGLCIIAQLLAL